MTFRDDEHLTTLELIRELLTDTRTLIRQEMALARAEVREELSRVVAVLAAVAIAAGTLALGGIWILIAITRGIADVFNWPLSGVYAGVGIALGIIGLVCLAVGWHQVQKIRIVPETRHTLREHLPPWPVRPADDRI